ncbi:hypothetical protein ACWGKA_14080 [Streptomyces luteogriseus]
MSAPLVVNTRDGGCWTRRTVTRGGVALYAPESVKTCPNFVMATLAELAEHGIAGSADALPVPVGPQMPEFPPPPKTELEKLHGERARLQGLLADAVREVHAVRRERDLIRERVSEPFGCRHCGTAKRSHGRRYLGGVGMHAWERPSDEQVKDRMLARRVARMAWPSNLSLWEEGPGAAGLEAESLPWVEQLDETSLGNFLHALGMATDVRPLDEALVQVRDVVRSFREALPEADGITRRIAPVQALRDDEPAEAYMPRTERQRWVDIADALNAAHAADMPVSIDLDGTLTDHRMWSVVWDREAERWSVAGYDVDAEDPCHPCGCPKRFGRHAMGCPTLGGDA